MCEHNLSTFFLQYKKNLIKTIEEYSCYFSEIRSLVILIPKIIHQCEVPLEVRCSGLTCSIINHTNLSASASFDFTQCEVWINNTSTGNECVLNTQTLFC